MNSVTVGCVIILATPFAVFGACWVVLLIAYNSYAPRSTGQRHGLDLSATAILVGTVILSILALIVVEKLLKKR